jgi:plastocyanin
VAGDVPGADVTGTLSDYSIALSAPTVNAAPTLRFRAAYPAGADMHNFTLRNSSHTTVCGTTNLGVGAAGTFTVTNLPPGSYELVCTIHVAYGMRVAFTVN